MKSWYSKVRDTELIDGSIRADYVVTFETDNIELKREVEKYLQGIMDRTEFTMPTMDKCHKCKHWNYSYGCRNKKGICQFEALADRKTEPQTMYYPQVDGITPSVIMPKDEPQTDKETVLDPSFAELTDEQYAEAMKLIQPQTDCDKCCLIKGTDECRRSRDKGEGLGFCTKTDTAHTEKERASDD